MHTKASRSRISERQASREAGSKRAVGSHPKGWEPTLARADGLRYLMTSGLVLLNVRFVIG